MSSTTTSTAPDSPALAHTFTRSAPHALDSAADARAVMQGKLPSLDALQQCTSISSLRADLVELCSDHGELMRLDIVPAVQAGRQQAVCLMRMRTPAQEHSLMRAMGIGRFGGELVLVVNLQPWLSASKEPAALGAQHH